MGSWLESFLPSSGSHSPGLVASFVDTHGMVSYSLMAFPSATLHKTQKVAEETSVLTKGA